MNSYLTGISAPAGEDREAVCIYRDDGTRLYAKGTPGLVDYLKGLEKENNQMRFSLTVIKSFMLSIQNGDHKPSKPESTTVRLVLKNAREGLGEEGGAA